MSPQDPACLAPVAPHEAALNHYWQRSEAMPFVLHRCYCALDDQTMADALEKLTSVEEKELRRGHLLSMITKDHDRAQVSHIEYLCHLLGM